MTTSNVDYVAKAIHDAVKKFQKWQMPNSEAEEEKMLTKILTVEF